MIRVNVTELRQNLPRYLADVKTGESIQVLSHGKAIAQINPIQDEREAARTRLRALREKSVLGDVMSPLDESWSADEDHL